jgi:hypothetical protein
MKQDDARRMILSEWATWAAEKRLTNPRGTDGFIFFGFIQKERPHLLEFKTPVSDKWQVVHGWLTMARLASD